jgi:hypothetical protein
MSTRYRPGPRGRETIEMTSLSPAIEELQRELADAEQEVVTIIMRRLKPGLTAQERVRLRNLEQSTRAKVELRRIALEHAQGRE